MTHEIDVQATILNTNNGCPGFPIRNEAELQATLDLLRDTYNQRRPHQSLSGHTPAEAWGILQKRKSKPKRPRRR